MVFPVLFMNNLTLCAIERICGRLGKPYTTPVAKESRSTMLN